jgi:CO dehydrogenase/acetyl-CoA synthase alpha subunit
VIVINNNSYSNSTTDNTSNCNSNSDSNRNINRDSINITNADRDTIINRNNNAKDVVLLNLLKLMRVCVILALKIIDLCRKTSKNEFGKVLKFTD